MVLPMHLSQEDLQGLERSFLQLRGQVQSGQRVGLGRVGFRNLPGRASRRGLKMLEVVGSFVGFRHGALTELGEWVYSFQASELLRCSSLGAWSRPPIPPLTTEFGLQLPKEPTVAHRKTPGGPHIF